MKERYVDVGRIIGRFKIGNQVKVKCYLNDMDDFIRIGEFYVKTLTGFKRIDLVYEFKTSEYLVYRVENMLPEVVGHLKGKEVFARYEMLPKVKRGEYYVVDLEECVVVEHTGEKLGKVEKVLESDNLFFLEVAGYVIPFRERYIKEVSIENRVIKLSEEFSREKEFLR